MSEEIEQLIRSYPGLVIVQIVEPVLGHEAAMDALAAEIRPVRPDVRVVQVVYSLHREWARAFQMHGSPGILIFQSGKLRIRLKGRVEGPRLCGILKQAGLL
ncbi:MAG: hypothetical protein N3D11_13935 [Candidatus Sumerlaeia bacterium]|nr:hypothetical protein [Candidatus Sumerlaeia bacterium]